jgi:REP element-mobilizing transposase RayT
MIALPPTFFSFAGKLLKGEPGYVHLVIDFPPDVDSSKLVNNLQTVSSRLIPKEFADVINQICETPSLPAIPLTAV